MRSNERKIATRHCTPQPAKSATVLSNAGLGEPQYKNTAPYPDDYWHTRTDRYKKVQIRGCRGGCSAQQTTAASSQKILLQHEISLGPKVIPLRKAESMGKPRWGRQSSPWAMRATPARRRAGIILSNCKNRETCNKKEKPPFDDHFISFQAFQHIPAGGAC